MAQKTLNIGTVANDGTGDPLRTLFSNSQDNFTELYAGLANNIVVINEEADFPVQDATTITWESGNRYYFGAPVSTSKSIIVEDSVAVEGAGQAILALTYTGTGVMFTSAAGWNMFNLAFDCPNGTVFAQTGTNFMVMRNSTCTNAKDMGSFTNAGLFWNSSSFTSITGQGLQFFGSSQGFLYTTGTLVGSSASFVGLDLGTATFDLFRLIDSTIAGPSGAIALKGLAASGNINSGERALVDTTDLAAGAITPLSGIDEQDIRWFFSQVTGTMNSRNAADAFLTGGSETITISASSTFVEIGVPSAGGVSWASDISDRFTVGTDGVITYIGEEDIEVQLTGRATVEKVGGGADEIEVQFAKNWISGPGIVKSRAVTQNATPTTVPFGALAPMVTNDDIRAIFANNTGTSDIIASVTSLEVIGG